MSHPIQKKHTHTHLPSALIVSDVYVLTLLILYIPRLFIQLVQALGFYSKFTLAPQRAERQRASQPTHSRQGHCSLIRELAERAVLWKDHDLLKG